MLCESCQIESSDLLTAFVYEDEEKKVPIGSKRRVCGLCLEGLKHVGIVEIEINNLRDLARPHIQAIIEKATLEGKGTFTPPPLDLAAIKARADQLDGKSQIKADIFMLLLEIDKLTNG